MKQQEMIDTNALNLALEAFQHPFGTAKDDLTATFSRWNDVAFFVLCEFCPDCLNRGGRTRDVQIDQLLPIQCGSIAKTLTNDADLSNQMLLRNDNIRHGG